MMKRYTKTGRKEMMDEMAKMMPNFHCAWILDGTYNRGVVIELLDGSKWLKDYDTIVCGINKDGNFERLWNGYSLTTMRDINIFCEEFGHDGYCKKDWEALQLGTMPFEILPWDNN